MRGGCQRDHRQPLRLQAREARRIPGRPVPRPGLGAGTGPSRLRRGGLLRVRRPHAAELLRARIPLLQRRARPGVPGRERRVRVPGPEADIRARRRRSRQDRLRQRHRHRPRGLRRGSHHRAARQVRGPLRLRVLILQPEFRPREGLRGERGGVHQAQPAGPHAAAHQRRGVQQEPAGKVHGVR